MHMIERVARVLCAQMGEDPNLETPHHPKVTHLWQHYTPSARAAIEAMREPTADMVTFGMATSARDDIDLTADEVHSIFAAMIDAALQESKETEG